MIIGYAYVVGDILHRGHIQHLKNCRALCDKLIVGVLTDRATMEKKVRPIIPFVERLDIIDALGVVAVPQATYSPRENIRAIKPDMLFESTSHNKRSLELNEKLMKKLGGRMITMPYFPLTSSTSIKEKIVKQRKGVANGN